MGGEGGGVFLNGPVARARKVARLSARGRLFTTVARSLNESLSRTINAVSTRPGGGGARRLPHRCGRSISANPSSTRARAAADAAAPAAVASSFLARLAD